MERIVTCLKPGNAGDNAIMAAGTIAILSMPIVQIARTVKAHSHLYLVLFEEINPRVADQSSVGLHAIMDSDIGRSRCFYDSYCLAVIRGIQGHRLPRMPDHIEVTLEKFRCENQARDLSDRRKVHRLA